jgi:predicted nicotinamide N-methyase
MSGDIVWREYNVHDDYDARSQNNKQETQDDDEEEETHQPVDIFAPQAEDTYAIHEETIGNVTITLRQQEDYEVSTGMSVWKGSEILCQYLIQHPDLVCDKRVLELGAGVGLCGIVSGKVLGASSVLMTDGDHIVLDNLRHNVELNNLDKNAVSCPQLIWGKERAEDFERKYGQQDVILATDCVYVTKSVRPLFETVAQLLVPDGVFLFVNSCASICPLEDVMSIGKDFGFVASPDEMWYLPGNEKKDPVYVFRG